MRLVSKGRIAMKVLWPAFLVAAMADDVVLELGWGRLIFGQTFADPQTLADVQLKQAAQSAIDATQAADRPARASGWTIAAVVVAGLSSVSTIILALALKAT